MTRAKLSLLLLRYLQSNALLQVDVDMEIPRDVQLYSTASGSPVLRVRFEHETFHIIVTKARG